MHEPKLESGCIFKAVYAYVDFIETEFCDYNFMMLNKTWVCQLNKQVSLVGIYDVYNCMSVNHSLAKFIMAINLDFGLKSRM